MRTIIAGIVAFAGLVAAACSITTSTVPLSDLGSRIALPVCEKVFQCCTADEILARFQGSMVTDEASCVAFIEGLYAQYSLPEYQASIMAGRVEFNANVVNPCVEHIDNLTCPGFSRALSIDDFVSVPGCDPFMTPEVPLGERCTQNYECTTGNCVGAAQNFDGECMPMPTEGQECLVNCATGSYCAADSAEDMNICVAQQPTGFPCGSDDECVSGTCTQGFVCAAPGSVCNGV